jgi:hypothetical protein
MHKISALALSGAFLMAVAAAAQAQSSCDSDGQPQPVALLERFINADCEACWSDAATAKAGPGEVALDWVVPGSRGDDAPLASVARRDGLVRLEALHRKLPERSDVSHIKAQPRQRKLRVVRGLPFNDYIGTSIELQPATGGPWKAWLALVETIPIGIEGTPVERNLVRNVFQPPWDSAQAAPKDKAQKLMESRPMQIPEGAKGNRLRVIGWVEDARGRVVAAAQSVCRPER